jgi:4-amino-4-deoxy-L-arabinose transferase-like glycosyltransferase
LCTATLLDAVGLEEHRDTRHRVVVRDSRTIVPLLLILAGLAGLYLTLLQVSPNGGDHYYMADVGETQIVLNVWGTLHATGYPLYVILGSTLVAVLRALGIPAAVAPGLVSLLWSLVAATAFYALSVHLTGRPIVSAAVSGLFGLTRTVWLHSVIAETYTMGLAILLILLSVALWQTRVPSRIWLLCLLGGIGVAHHRLVVTLVPALLYAVWPKLTRQLRRLPRVLLVGLLLGLLGFLPYLYLPLRAAANAPWVYDEPGTWHGFWDQFTGREAAHYVRWHESGAEIHANFSEITGVLVSEVTIPGVLLGVAGLVVAVHQPRRRRTAVTLLLCGAAAYGFHILLWHTHPLPGLTLPTTLSLALGWLFLADRVLSLRNEGRYVRSGLGLTAGLFALWLIWLNVPFVKALTRDTTGIETIALVQNAPSGSTLMMEWGPRYFAAGFAHDVLGQLEPISLVDHQADFGRIVREGVLVTPEYTFYNRPLAWWEEVLAGPVYLRAAAPHLVEIDTEGERAEPTPGRERGEGIRVLEQEVRCTDDTIILEVAWFASAKPEQDLSVFVHLLDGQGNIISQCDQCAPVYGWRPITIWEEGEVVRDIYPLRRVSGAEMVRYGLYQQLASGEFQNEIEFSIPVFCGE